MRVDSKERDQALADTIKTLGNMKFSEAFANFLRQIIDFDNLIILAYHCEESPTVLYREYNDPIVFSSMDSEYLNGAYLLDPYYRAHLNGPKTGLHRLIDVAPDQFKRTSYFNVYYQKTTLIDEIAAFANINPEVTITACIGKDRSSGICFPKKDVKALRGYEKAISALLEGHWKNYLPDRVLSTSLLPLINRLRTELEKEMGVRLSPRQAQVAMFVLRGHSSISIGLNLGISPETVKVFRRQLYAKCNISSQAELFAMIMPLFSRLSGTRNYGAT